MKRTRRRWLWFFLIASLLGVAFFAAPLVAGYNRIGGRDGPAFYPRGLHESLYIIGHEAATGIKPRIGLTWGLYKRPLFWGQSRRPKPEVERKEYLEKMVGRGRGTKSSIYQRLLEENQRIDAERAGSEPAQ